MSTPPRIPELDLELMKSRARRRWIENGIIQYRDQDILALIAEVERLREVVKEARSLLDIKGASLQQWKEMQQENARLREALEEYAKGENWWQGTFSDAKGKGGPTLAREALNATPSDDGDDR